MGGFFYGINARNSKIMISFNAMFGWNETEEKEGEGEVGIVSPSSG